MKTTTETTISVTITAAALIIAGSVAYRTFFQERKPRLYDMGNPPPVQVGALWTRLNTGGTRIGSPTAKVTIAEFIDFECPFCARYAPVLRSLVREYNDSVSIVLHHFPLEIHRFAQVAAQSSECARDQSRFREMHDILLAKQDSFGLKPWGEFAEEAGIPDTSKFVSCAKKESLSPRITAGLELGKKLAFAEHRPSS